jgi:hypothetical protein
VCNMRQPSATSVTKEACKFFTIIGKTKLDAQGRLNVEGKVIKNGCPVRELPVQFGKVDGLFSVNSMPQLDSLVNCPEWVGGGFYCDATGITSLVGGPRCVQGGYSCTENNLVTLEGAPETVGGLFELDWAFGLPLLRLLQYGRIHLEGNAKVCGIIQKYASLDKTTLRQRTLQCQKALIDAGFAENARL